MKTFFRWLLVVLGLFYLTLLYFWNFSRPDFYRRCDGYTTEMNGGIHPFYGTNHRIELCGLTTDADVRLRVFTMDGELLAERFLWPIEERQSSLSYGTDYMIYHDSGNAEFMAMPPSRWEWLRARLPRMWL